MVLVLIFSQTWNKLPIVSQWMVIYLIQELQIWQKYVLIINMLFKTSHFQAQLILKMWSVKWTIFAKLTHVINTIKNSRSCWLLLMVLSMIWKEQLIKLFEDQQILLQLLLLESVTLILRTWIGLRLIMKHFSAEL